MLFSLWSDSPHRPTRDLDLMAYGKPDIGHLKLVFQSLCNLDVENDGMEFFADTVSSIEIREGNIYQGVRLKLVAKLAGAKLRLQIDVGFGFLESFLMPPFSALANQKEFQLFWKQGGPWS